MLADRPKKPSLALQFSWVLQQGKYLIGAEKRKKTLLSSMDRNIVGPFLFKDDEAPGYFTGVIGCMVSRALEVSQTGSGQAITDTVQIVVILIFRFIFVRANRRRDRAVAEGKVSYDANLTGLEDISDWKNPAFRYIAVSRLCRHSLVSICSSCSF